MSWNAASCPAARRRWFWTRSAEMDATDPTLIHYTIVVQNNANSSHGCYSDGHAPGRPELHERHQSRPARRASSWSGSSPTWSPAMWQSSSTRSGPPWTASMSTPCTLMPRQWTEAAMLQADAAAQGRGAQHRSGAKDHPLRRMAGSGLEYDLAGSGDNCGSEPGGGYGGVKPCGLKGCFIRREARQGAFRKHF